jgi:hypothetical protein
MLIVKIPIKPSDFAKWPDWLWIWIVTIAILAINDRIPQLLNREGWQCQEIITIRTINIR